ncbi:MAG: hypothetical protein Q8L29_03255, partial [archaeon]|nr:hypothetical protein [archaeon]
KFIREARKRGFDDYEIREPLLRNDWPVLEIESAFDALKPKKRIHYTFKNRVELYFDNNLLKLLEKRAKKNLLTLPEQIEDIIRRSCINAKTRKILPETKLDDLLVGVFSRRKCKRKK